MKMNIGDKLFLAVAIVLISASAGAQQPTSTTKEFVLKVDPKDIELISEGLGSLPYNKVAPLFSKLQQQISNQAIPSPMPTNPQGNPLQE